MTDQSHLYAIRERIVREIGRIDNAKTPRERELRAVWLAQAEREEAREMDFLGMQPHAPMESMTDDDILRELGL
jgi:hypothetical protein